MKSLNAKRIAAVAASLVMGIAVAGQGVTFGNIPIISNQGQPVVQIVVGSHAAPSDGVVAANIAAVIGNLALTTQNVTATVVATNASAANCVVTTPKCTLTNQQVWLGEKGLSAPSGSYSFSALIGSVINRAIQLNTPANTKAIQGSGTQYVYQETTSLTTSPAPSPYYNVGVPLVNSVTANYNGGGVSFGSSFSSGAYDNILQVSSAQLPSLLSNSGSNGESEYLWLTGFPVFNQESSVNNFQVVDLGGAYQATFNKPIQNRTTSNALNINVPITLLGENWTIVNATGPSGTVSNNNFVDGGSLWLASSLTPQQTVYVGHNVTNASVGGFNVQLTDLGQPNSNGVSTAAIQVYYNGQPTNTTQISAYTTQKFNVSGHLLYVHVNQTFAGLYAYQKWAKIQLYSNLVQLKDGKQFNQTGDKGWNTKLWWTNTSTSGAPDALQSIVIYNTSPATLSPGQSFTFIPNPAKYQLTFVGDNLGNNYDPVQAQTAYQSALQYQNLGNVGQAPSSLQVTNITEPAQELVVTSSIPNAFSYSGQTTSSVTYDLTPYQLNEYGNANTAVTGGVNGGFGKASLVTWSFASTGTSTGNWISNTNPLTVRITGYSSNTAASATSDAVTFNALSGNFFFAGNSLTNLFNVTGIQIQQTLPPGTLTIAVKNQTFSTNAIGTNSLATLVSAAPAVVYSQSGKNYDYLTPVSGNSVIYNQQNGQPTSNFVLSTVTPSGTGAQQYFSYTENEVAVPTNTAAVDSLGFGIENSTAGIVQSGSLFQLNYSATGAHNNATYTSTTGTSLNVKQGFRTERGSQVASITPSSVTFNLAKAVDQLQFVVGAATTNTTALSTTTNYGPYTVGQQTNLPNVTIAAVNATCSFTATSCSVVPGAYTAVPSVTQAVVSSHLNTATTPLAVLDSAANNASTLVVVGSAYVNSVAGQIFASNPQFASSFENGGASGPNAVTVQSFGSNRILVAGYTANQTAQAGDQFINQLLSQASSTK
jgi:hypothetical protein